MLSLKRGIMLLNAKKAQMEKKSISAGREKNLLLVKAGA